MPHAKFRADPHKTVAVYKEQRVDTHTDAHTHVGIFTSQSIKTNIVIYYGMLWACCVVMRETLDKYQGGLQIGGRIVTNLRLHYADDIILLATSEAELQELLDRLDRVSHKYSLLINVNKIKVMARDGIACRIFIQNEQLEQVDTFPYLVSRITEDSECMKEFHTRLNRGQVIGASLQKI